MTKLGTFIGNLYDDGFKILSIAAPVASLTFTVCKAFGIAPNNLHRISYAWAFFPITLWLFVAYVRRWHLYSQAVLDTLKPTWPIADAFNYMVNDSVAELKQPPAPHIGEYGPAKGKLIRYGGVPHNDARAKLQEQLIAGHLRIWGLRERKPGHSMVVLDPIRREIPKSYWDRADLEYLACFHTTETVLQTAIRDGISDYRYSGLMVSRDQIENLWPRKQFLQQVHDRWRGHIRIDYWQRSLDKNYRLIDGDAPKFAPPENHGRS